MRSGKKYLFEGLPGGRVGEENVCVYEVASVFLVARGENR